MFLKNILLEIGGTAAVGGIGYGIYASSKPSEKENTSEGQGGDSVQTEVKEEVDTEQDGGDSTTGGADGASGEKASSAGETTPIKEPAA